MLKTAIVGASGYVGGEILRLALDHPQLDVTRITSDSQAGRFAHTVHPNLRGRTSLRFDPHDRLEPVDVLFLCLPHGKAASRMGEFADNARYIIDASADFRLRDPDVHTRFYSADTVCSEWREQFVYGLPELERNKLKGARLISGVGCNATVTNIALWPLARAGLIDRVVVDVKVGSSEGGGKASDASHHPERSGAVRSFAPVGHRHQAEIAQELALEPHRIFFSVTAIEMVRGALATSHVFLSRSLDDKEVWALYREAFQNEPFVRIVRDRVGLYRLPEPKILTGTNYCDVGWTLDDHGDRLVVVSAIDNLMKGAAGSAVQSLNVAADFEETSALGFSGLHPI